jgi:hypothetical protein
MSTSESDGLRPPLSDGPHQREPPPRGTIGSALRILSERFARGEIQGDEYEEKKITIFPADNTK